MGRFRLHTKEGGRFSDAAVAAVAIATGMLIVALAAILSLTQANPTAATAASENRPPSFVCRRNRPMRGDHARGV